MTVSDMTDMTGTTTTTTTNSDNNRRLSIPQQHGRMRRRSSVMMVNAMPAPSSGLASMLIALLIVVASSLVVHWVSAAPAGLLVQHHRGHDHHDHGECTSHYAPLPAANTNSNHTDTHPRLFRRAAARRAYRGKDCPATIIVDRFYRASFHGAGINAQLAAQTEVQKAMREVDGLYRQQFDVGLPLARVLFVDASNDEGTGLGQPSASAEQVLAKLKRGVEQGRGVFAGLKGPQMCAVHLVTYQDFGTKLGSAYTAQPGAGGVCDPNGYNTAVSNRYMAGKPTNWDIFVESLRHEFGHNFGSPHDGQMPAPPTGTGNPPQCDPKGAPFIMHPIVTGGTNKDVFSACSQTMIDHILSTQATCFVARGSVAYAQWPKADATKQPPKTVVVQPTVTRTVALPSPSSVVPPNGKVPVPVAAAMEQTDPRFPTVQQQQQQQKLRSANVVTVVVKKTTATPVVAPAQPRPTTTPVVAPSQPKPPAPPAPPAPAAPRQQAPPAPRQQAPPAPRQQAPAVTLAAVPMPAAVPAPQVPGQHVAVQSSGNQQAGSINTSGAAADQQASMSVKSANVVDQQASMSVKSANVVDQQASMSVKSANVVDQQASMSVKSANVVDQQASMDLKSIAANDNDNNDRHVEQQAQTTTTLRQVIHVVDASNNVVKVVHVVAGTNAK